MYTLNLLSLSLFTYIRTHTHTHARAHTHTHAHTHIYTNTHTKHTHTSCWPNWYRGWPQICRTWVQNPAEICQKGVSSFTSSHYILAHLAYLVHKSGRKTATSTLLYLSSNYIYQLLYIIVSWWVSTWVLC